MTKVKNVTGAGFEQLAYTLLVTERRASVGEVAHALGLTPGALYGRLHGRSRFKPDEIRRLIEVVDDQRLIRYFADDSRYVVARRPAAGEPSAGVMPATAVALHGAVELMRVVVEALEDGPRLSHRDLALILQEVKETETAMANLRAAVESAKP